MITMSKRSEIISRLSLSFLWLFTAATSFYWGRTIGYEVLAQQEIQGQVADVLINAGSLLDALIGIWLLTTWQLMEIDEFLEHPLAISRLKIRLQKFFDANDSLLINF